MRPVFLSIVVLVAGCAKADINFANLPCDDGACLAGYVCDEVTNLCVSEGALGDSAHQGGDWGGQGDPTGDPARGDPLQGDPQGDPLQGDPLQGDPAGPGDPLQGDPAGPGDPLQGDPAAPGDPLQGDPAAPGDPLQGDPASPGDPLQGDPLQGDPVQGDPAGPGDPVQVSCVPVITWTADFDADPTAQNLNGDGVNDWKIDRSGGTFPTNELSGGVWSSGSWSGILDSNPNHDFAGETRVTVRMRATSVGGVTSVGAVFWINVDHTAGEFAPLYVALTRRANSTQRLRLHGKSNNTDSVELHEVTDLGLGFQDIELIIMPATNEVTLTLGGTAQGTFTYPTFGPLNNDRFATLVAWGVTAEFDDVLIEACAP